MRPRHKAAENPGGAGDAGPQRGASMRPRHKAAENIVAYIAAGAALRASMRPRHKAAENLQVVPPSFENWKLLQ